MDFSTTHLDNVKRIVFGLQKQANATNDAVVKIIARELSSKMGVSDSTSEDEVATALENYVNAINKGDIEPNDAFMLLCGEQSLANLKSTNPHTVSVDWPNPESPKRIYRIEVLGEMPDKDNSGEVGTAPAPVHVYEGNENVVDASVREDDDFYTRATKIKDAILPLVPDGVKKEIPDNEYAQALCCAEYYYKNKA